MSTPTDVVQVPALLARLRAQDSGRPRVTWYGADGERVELSARVLENWVAKTANLLREELDVEVGDRVRLALPAHWRSVVWHLAVAAAGAVPAGADRDADGDGGGGEVAVVVVADGDDAPTTGTGAVVPRHVVVQALPALAFRASAVPPGALDAAAEVAGYGDDVPVVAGAPGLAVAATPGEQRVLLTAGGSAEGARAVLDAVVAALAGGGSAVLLGPGAPDAERVAAQEGVTRP